MSHIEISIHYLINERKKDREYFKKVLAEIKGKRPEARIVYSETEHI